MAGILIKCNRACRICGERGCQPPASALVFRSLRIPGSRVTANGLSVDCFINRNTFQESSGIYADTYIGIPFAYQRRMTT